MAAWFPPVVRRNRLPRMTATPAAPLRSAASAVDCRPDAAVLYRPASRTDHRRSPGDPRGLGHRIGLVIVLWRRPHRGRRCQPGSWLTHGRTHDEQRYRPLAKINTGTVGQLGLAWTYELRTGRGQQATPLVVDGAMYVTSVWSQGRRHEAGSSRSSRKSIGSPRSVLPVAACTAFSVNVLRRVAEALSGRLQTLRTSLKASPSTCDGRRRLPVAWNAVGTGDGAKETVAREDAALEGALSAAICAAVGYV